MPKQLSIKVYQQLVDSDPQLLYESEIDHPFSIGRQETEDPKEVGFVKPAAAKSQLKSKLVIASSDDRGYSRRFAEVSFSGDQVAVRNTSESQAIFTGSSIPISPRESRLLHPPFEVTLGNRIVSFAVVGEISSDEKASIIHSLPPSLPPSLMGTLDRALPVRFLNQDFNDGLSGEQLVELLQSIMQILQNSPSSHEFFENATKAMADALNLDHVVIVFESSQALPFGDENETWGRWRSQALYCANPGTAWNPSEHFLETVYRDKQTVYQMPEVRTESLIGVTSLVASPIKNAKDDVIGVIYCDRSITKHVSLDATEAMFIELFANGISVGLERLGQERQISQIRARFDQFFTPTLARQLESDPTMLEPRSVQLSVLFADIRGFSRISERIGPEKTIHWINSVMSTLTDCVFTFSGVVVDYIGDEIMAMWGAPEDRDNHAELAVRSALSMIEKLPEINAVWADIIGESVQLGIGINTGEAQVGNTGSERKFKYGPLGDVVNVGSRLQSATKQVHANVLITESTAAALPTDLVRRKIRSVRFVNVERVITVYEIPFRPDENWNRLKEEYEKGLELYEKGEFSLAKKQLASVVHQWVDDGPSTLLFGESVKWFGSSPQDFDPVWKLNEK